MTIFFNNLTATIKYSEWCENNDKVEITKFVKVVITDLKKFLKSDIILLLQIRNETCLITDLSRNRTNLLQALRGLTGGYITLTIKKSSKFDSSKCGNSPENPLDLQEKFIPKTIPLPNTDQYLEKVGLRRA
jgi:hypothetical protein